MKMDKNYKGAKRSERRAHRANHSALRARWAAPESMSETKMLNIVSDMDAVAGIVPSERQLLEIETFSRASKDLPKPGAKATSKQLNNKQTMKRLYNP